MKNLTYIILAMTLTTLTLQAKADNYGGYNSYESQQQSERDQQHMRELQQDQDAAQQRKYIEEQNYQSYKQESQQRLNNLPCENAANCNDR